MRASLSRRVSAVAFGSLLIFWVSSTGATTLHVPGRYATIAAGLAAATYGDSIVVASGTYHEHSLVMKSGVVLRGESADPSSVIIDGDAVTRIMLCSGVDASTRIEGFTFRNGHVSGDGMYFWGAGMLCNNGASPLIAHCVFESNVAESGIGGGLACVHASASLVDCDFRDNDANGVTEGLGGGVACQYATATFDGCRFRNNAGSNRGGAIYAVHTSMAIRSCEFSENFSSAGGAIYWDLSGDDGVLTDTAFLNNSSDGQVSALVCRRSTSPHILRCIFRGNTGGTPLACPDSSPLVEESRFEHNSAPFGGAIGGGGDLCRPAFRNCLIWDNSADTGGALYFGNNGQASFMQCTFVGNRAISRGSLIFLRDASVGFGHCIVTGNGPAELVWCQAWSGLPFGPKFSCTDVFGNPAGDWTSECMAAQQFRDNNFTEDPRFCDAAAGDFTLSHDSPCSDHSECGQVGAFGQGCGPTATVPTTWGTVKGLFK